MAGKRKLKIGVLVDQLLPGGVQKAAIEEVKNFQKMGHQVRLLVLMRRNYAPWYAHLAKGIKVKFLSDTYPLFLRHSIRFPIFSFLSTLHLLGPWLAPRAVKKSSYDLLISHGTTTCFTAQALWQKKQIPYVAVVHDPMLYILEKVYSQTILRFLFPVLAPLAIHKERSFVGDSLATVADSHVHTQFLKSRYGIVPFVIPHGCRSQPKPPTKRGPLILALSRWESKKNPDFLLKLLKELPTAKLMMAGTWTNKTELKNFRRLIKKEDLVNRVKVISSFKETELPKLCQKARFWLHPHFEAFGMGGLEVAGYGLPLIITANSGITNLFEHGKEGFFPKNLDLNDFKKYCQKLLADENLALKMGKNAWKKAKGYSWANHTAKLLKIAQEQKRTKFFNITTLENGYVSLKGVSGGDKVFRSMLENIPDDYNCTIVIPDIGYYHWKKEGLGKKAQFKILPPALLLGKKNPFFVFFSYLIRAWQSYSLLKHQQNLGIVYSSTDIFADIVPAFLLRRRRPDIKWIARIFHLIPPPASRPGNFIVNLGSFLLQRLSFSLIKQKADVILVANKDLQQKLVKLSFPKIRMDILGAGIDFEKINTHQIKKAYHFEGVFLGRLHRTKGIFDLPAIWQQVLKKFPKVKLAIIGEGDSVTVKKLKSMFKEKKIVQSIKFFGFLKEKDVWDILKQSKVFLFTDHEAGWGMAIAEAMACKLPVVGYNLKIFGSVFHQGFITSPKQKPKQLAQKVNLLFGNEQKRQKLSDQAFKQAEKLSWKRTSKSFVGILDLLSGRKNNDQ